MICAAYIVILSVRNAGIVFIQEVYIIDGHLVKAEHGECLFFRLSAENSRGNVLSKFLIETGR